MATLPEFNLTKLNVTIESRAPGVFRSATVHRVKVPGGWFVLTESMQGLSGITFYPDPKHEWNGGSAEQATGDSPPKSE